jgi:diguanylate cyclase (GGDEF)-like protein
MIAWRRPTRVVRQGGLGAVPLWDLDDFKGVNDSFGHLAGDKLLAAIARRLEQVTRAPDSLCRFGGDEFIYLAEGLTSPREAESVARRLLNALVEPFSIVGAQLKQRASIGIVVGDEQCANCGEIVQHADVALYEAKRAGKGHQVIFDPERHHQPISQLALVEELRHSFHAGQLVLDFQPVVDLTSNEVVGFEALMRWLHRERGWVRPSVFIPLAEQSDLFLELGAFAIREAVSAASWWLNTNDHGARPYVTVDLSARQFHDHGLVSMIVGALRTSGPSPGRLIIEITEGVGLLDVTHTLEVIEELNRLGIGIGIGIGIALDDFGTGFSSLSYLVLSFHASSRSTRRSFARITRALTTTHSWRPSSRSAINSR